MPGPEPIELDTARIAYLYRECGWTGPMLAKEFNVHASTIYDRLSRLRVNRRARGFESGPAGRRPSLEAVSQTVALYEAGFTVREVAERIGLTHSAVRNRLLRAGIQMRSKGRRNPRLQQRALATELRAD